MKTAASVVAILIACAYAAFAAPPEPASVTSDAQVKIAVTVAPQPVGAGSETSVTVKVDPKPGIKMNKYPKIKLQVPAVDGLIGAAEQSLGNTAPPPADQLEANYFHGGVDPLSVTLHVDAHAAAGRHEIHAKLSYFYCVAASGYCAPAKAELTIPVTIR
jgi:hypothetical protein